MTYDTKFVVPRLSDGETHDPASFDSILACDGQMATQLSSSSMCCSCSKN